MEIARLTLDLDVSGMALLGVVSDPQFPESRTTYQMSAEQLLAVASAIDGLVGSDHPIRSALAAAAQHAQVRAGKANRLLVPIWEKAMQGGAA